MMMRTIHRIALLTAALAPIACESSDTRPCSTCIVLDTVVTISPLESHPISLDPVVARAPSGTTYAVVHAPDGGVIALYDANGAHIVDIGRRGAGPFEYRYVSALFFDVSDSLYIVDSRNRRIDVYSPDGAPVRSIPTAGPVHQGAWLEGSGILLQGVVASPALAGYKARLITADGTENGVAPYTDAYDASDFEYDRFPMAVTRTGNYWLASRFDYVLESHSVDRPTPDRLSVMAEWFEPAQLPRELTGIVDPRPVLSSIAWGEDGHLWVLGIKPVVPAVLPPLTPYTRPSQALVDSLTDHVLDVVNPETGTIVASRRFSMLPLYFMDDRYGYVADEGADGTVRIHVVYYSLEPERRSRFR